MTKSGEYGFFDRPRKYKIFPQESAMVGARVSTLIRVPEIQAINSLKSSLRMAWHWWLGI